MSTLNPPIALEKPDNQARVDYIQDYASGMYILLNLTNIFSFFCLYIMFYFYVFVFGGWGVSECLGAAPTAFLNHFY